ncbi:MAG TPA: hypothetical protein VEF34_08740, partial [Syntrophobacteraceae bacterium]|nr:hypothetical protein [Syntrophobacteraceae bacterium]
MDLTQETKQHIKVVATETLDLFEEVAVRAKTKLSDTRVLGPEVLVNINTLTSGLAVQRLAQIDRANRECYQILAREPAIARVVVTDDEGGKKVYYICRTTPVTGFQNLASYRAPIGRLASMPVGSRLRLPKGNIVEVVERVQLRPLSRPDGWDSRDTIVEAELFGPITIESLRSLLNEIAGTEQTENLLEQLLAEENLIAGIVEGIRRGIISKMGLRDQPVLDQYQDEIFRLPLDTRLLILGAPGTGKTTTLIRRLGQKLDMPFLDEDERRIVDNAGATSGIPHESSWLMFTPTELLRQYVQEAFAREGVPADDLHIRTWQHYRHELAKNVFGVLRTASGGGTFILKDSIQSLKADTADHSILWYSDFDEWQRATFLRELREAAQFLSEGQAKEVKGLGQRLASILDRAVENSLPSAFSALAVEALEVLPFVSRLKEATDSAIKSVLNLQMNRNRGFLDELVSFIDELQRGQAAEMEDQEDTEAQDEEELSVLPTGRAAA